jgi:hypothetical protein
MGLWIKNDDGSIEKVAGSGGGGGSFDGEHVLTGDVDNPPEELDVGQLMWDGVEGGSGGGGGDGGPHNHDYLPLEGGTLTGGLIVGGSVYAQGDYVEGQYHRSSVYGTEGWPCYSFSDEPSTGFYRAASGVVGVSTGGVERLRVGASSTFTGNLQVDGTTTIHGNKVGVNLTALVSPPADHWTTYPGVWGGYGMHAGTQGGYMTSLTNNGYRVADGKWKSLGVNGQVGAVEIDLAPTGHFYVRVASNHPTGSAASPPTRFTVTESGPTFRAMPSKTRTVDDVLDRAETAEFPPEDDEGVVTMDGHDEVPLFEVVTALLAKVKELSERIEELEGN